MKKSILFGLLLLFSNSLVAQIGQVTFSPSAAVSLSGVIDIATGDVDGVNGVDIVVATATSVNTYLNNGSGSFTLNAARSLTLTGNTVSGITLNDFDNDGDLDLIVATSSGFGLRTYQNTGSAFTSAATESGGYTAGVRTAVIAGTRRIITGNSSNQIAIFSNTGSLGFTAATQADISGIPSHFAVANFGGDANPDVLAVSGGLIRSFRWSGGGINNEITSGLGTAPISISGVVRGIAVGDFDNDGNQDFAVSVSVTTPVLRVFRGRGDNTFTEFTGSPFATLTNPQRVAIADLNGDGRPDIVVVNGATTNTITVLLSSSTGAGNVSFTPVDGSPISVSSTPQVLSIANIDIGRPDILVTTSTGVDKLINANLPPGISSISPTSGQVNTAVTVTVNGVNFNSASQVTWNGASVPTTFVNGNQLTATVSAATVGTVVGTAAVRVFNPLPGGGTAGPFTFTATPGAAAALAFIQQPTATLAGITISPPPSVQLRDAFGNNVLQSGRNITLSMNTGTGTLSGTLTQSTNTAGLASFAGLSVNLVGAKTLRAQSAGLTDTTSNSFNINLSAEPTAQPTGLLLNTFAGSPPTISGVFIAANPAPSGYLVLRRTTVTAPTAPTDGVAYNIGDVFSGQRVVSNGNTNSFVDSVGLTEGVSYTYDVFSFNGSGFNINYLQASPLATPLVALPVELSSFDARQIERGVELVWTTTSEKNNAGFEVQRTENGIRNTENGGNWKVLGFVKGNGTTSQSQSYSFIDRTASGKVSYRLKQIDFDGQFEILPTVEVDAGLPRTFELGQNYPNPFNPSTLINYQLPVSGQVSLKVFDMLGREVATLVNQRQEAGRYSASFNAASLSSGVYFYRLAVSSASSQAGTFVQTNKMMLVK